MKGSVANYRSNSAYKFSPNHLAAEGMINYLAGWHSCLTDYLMEWQSGYLSLWLLE
jgi:hypothetical protein